MTYIVAGTPFIAGPIGSRTSARDGGVAHAKDQCSLSSELPRSVFVRSDCWDNKPRRPHFPAPIRRNVAIAMAPR